FARVPRCGERTVGSVQVVVPRVPAQWGPKLGLVPDQHAVQQFGAPHLKKRNCSQLRWRGWATRQEGPARRWPGCNGDEGANWGWWECLGGVELSCSRGSGSS